ncbi:MAG: 6-phosphogluconolactonase [Anaerolineae bacterium]
MPAEKETLGAEIVVLPDAQAVAEEAARRFAAAGQEAIAARGRYAAALAGGRTPALLYRLLASDEWHGALPWDRVHLFWGDERCVPAEHPDSNFGLAWREWLSHIDIPPANLHRIPCEEEPERAAMEYEEELRGFFGEEPAFDLIFLGVGEDGHTASIFPSTPAVLETRRWVMVNHRVGDPTPRVTLTLPVLNAARHVVFLVTGERKAVVVCRILLDPTLHRNALPAARVRSWTGSVTWLLDEPAAVLWQTMRASSHDQGS